MRCSKEIYQIVAKLISLLFLALFVYAAISKLLDFEHFKMQLSQSPFISNFAHGLVWAIPFIELLIAGLFLFPKHWVIAFYASFLLMGLFTIYIMLVLNFGNDIPCSCGGILQTLNWKEHIIFNMIFIAFAILGISISKQKKWYHNNSTT